MARPLAIDLFAGVGGASLGLEAAGFEIAAAVEYDPVIATTHAFNFPESISICQDVTTVSGSLLKQSLPPQWQERDIALLFASPPCQGFSTIGKGLVGDPRNDLIDEFVRIASELQPCYILMENVPGLLTPKNHGYLYRAIDKLEQVGYKIITPVRVLNSAHFGAPQARQRVFMMGYRQDVAPVAYPASQDYPSFSVFAAIADLATIAVSVKKDEGFAPWHSPDTPYLRYLTEQFELCHHRSVPDVLWGHVGAEHTPETIARFNHVPPGTTDIISRFPRLLPSGLCPTLRAGTGAERGAHTAPRPIHYAYPRCISIREAARLHAYPDWFQFHRTMWQGLRQVGNSVVPLVTKAIGERIIAALGVTVGEEDVREFAPADEQLLQLNRTQAVAQAS